MFPSLCVVLPKQGETTLLWYFFLHARSLYLLTIPIEIVAPALESTTSAIDSLEVAPVAFQDKRFPCCQVVQEPAPTHDMLQFVIGQTLVEHRQVVAEIEERLHGI